VSSDDDTRNDSKASPVQREYIREQELIGWALCAYNRETPTLPVITVEGGEGNE
jgi:hypothetical protein